MDRSVRYKGRSHEYGEREREKKHWLFADCASMPWDCAYRRDRVPPAGYCIDNKQRREFSLASESKALFSS